MDDTRLYVIADDVAKWNDGKGLFEMDDPLTDKVDVVAVNRYMGWYAPWPKARPSADGMSQQENLSSYRSSGEKLFMVSMAKGTGHRHGARIIRQI